MSEKLTDRILKQNEVPSGVGSLTLGKGWLRTVLEAQDIKSYEQGKRDERAIISRNLQDEFIAHLKCNPNTGDDYSLESHYLRRLYRYVQSLKGADK